MITKDRSVSILTNSFPTSTVTNTQKSVRRVYMLILTCSSAPPTTNRLVSVFIFSRISYSKQTCTSESEKTLTSFPSQQNITLTKNPDTLQLIFLHVFLQKQEELNNFPTVYVTLYKRKLHFFETFKSDYFYLRHQRPSKQICNCNSQLGPPDWLPEW